VIASRQRAAIFALLCAFALSASGPYRTQLSAQDLRHIRTVAVISAVGSSFAFEHVRNRELEWLGPPDSHFLEISDWELDPLITNEVTAALKPRFAIKPVAFESADFSSWNIWLLKRAALGLNGDPDIDAYVFILRDRQSDAIGFSIHALDGLGLYRNDSAAGVTVYACYRLVVVNAYTGETIASRRGLLSNGAAPTISAKPDLWPHTQNDLTEAQRRTILADEKNLIEATLLRTLKEMNLSRASLGQLTDLDRARSNRDR